MRSIKCAVLLVLLAGAAAFDHSACEEELERERKEDADSHGCRACKSIAVEAAPNCPKQGYDCDESLQLTSTPLDSCDCAELRCAATNATLAVDQELVKKVRCKDRKWISKTGEAESAVCARQCGLGICPAFRVLTPEEAVLGEPLVVQPPDAAHPCAWAECPSGSYMVDGIEHPQQEAASITCTGDTTWKYSGTEGETRNVKMAYCLKKQEGCLDAGLDRADTTFCTKPAYPNGCAEAIISPMSVTCANTGKLLLQAPNAPLPGNTFRLESIICDEGSNTWRFEVQPGEFWSQDETADAFDTPLKITCEIP